MSQLETKFYADGTSATGFDLPEVSPGGACRVPEPAIGRATIGKEDTTRVPFIVVWRELDTLTEGPKINRTMESRDYGKIKYDLAVRIYDPKTDTFVKKRVENCTWTSYNRQWITPSNREIIQETGGRPYAYAEVVLP